MKNKNKPNLGATASMKVAAFAFAALTLSATAQEQVYDNFDGNRVIAYGERSGVFDSLAANPGPNVVNKSAKCGMYVRNSARKFANIKMNLTHNLTGVEAFATYEGIPPRMKMKVFTSAPPGTLVEILLGNRRRNNDYPAGTHSQYQAYTSVSNEWEELEFKFAQIPQGSETAADQIDQVVLLFNPNSSTSDTYYFDDLAGPALGAEANNQAGEGKDSKPGDGKGKSKDKKLKDKKPISDKNTKGVNG
jgi:hypothetical protein